MANYSRRNAKKALTRDALLVASRQCFEAKGYADSTIRDIASAAGKSSAGIYAHWNSKRDIFAEIYGHWPIDGHDQARVMTILRAVNDGDTENATQRARALLWELTDPERYAEK